MTRLNSMSPLLLVWWWPDMVKMGGLGPVSACLASAAPSLRAMAAETLATALQNNPAVQQMAASANLLAVFLPMVARDPDIIVRTKVGARGSSRAACPPYACVPIFCKASRGCGRPAHTTTCTCE